MSWGQTGWDGDDLEPPESFGGDSESFAPRRLYVGIGSTKRVLVVDDVFFRFWEHSLYKATGKAKDKCLCLERNDLDQRGCPPCDDDMYPAYVGYLTVIDLGDVKYTDEGPELHGWTSSKDVLYQFERRAAGFKRGGKDKPGMMQEIRRLRQARGGSLVGCIYDVHRSGKLVETVGDKWSFVEQFPTKKITVKVDGEKKEKVVLDQEKCLELLLEMGADNPARGDNAGKVEMEPFDYVNEFKPHTYEALKSLLGGGGKKSSGSGARSEGAGYESDVPT